MSDDPAPAAGKRDRTLSSLLVAVQEILLESSRPALSVPRVIARAGVSQGTFYNYFDSLDAAVDGVGALLLVEHARLVDEVTAGVDDPAGVVTHSTRMTLRLAATGPGYARLLFDCGLPVDLFLGGLRARLAADVAVGLEQRRFRADDVEFVLSMASGSILGVALELYRRRLPLSAAEATAERLLLDLGLSAADAAQVAHAPLDLPDPAPLPIRAVPPRPAEGEGRAS